MKRNRIRIIGNILTFASVIFLVSSFRKMKIDLRIFADRRIFLSIFAGAVLVVVSLMISALAWKRTIAYFSEQNIFYLPAAKVYMQANLGKYIPGNMMHFIERNMFAAKEGIGQVQALAGSLMEIAGQLAAAVFLGIFLAFRDVWKLAELLFLPEYIAVLALLAVMGGIAFRILYKKKRSIQILCQKMRQPAFWKTFGINVCLYMAVLFLLSALMCMLVCLLAKQDLKISEAGEIMTVYVLAWMTGFMIPGAPGGLGVREFVITYLTKENRMQEVILLAMVLHRMITVFGDMLGYLWGKGNRR